MVSAASSDPCDGMSHDQIKDYLVQLAETHISNRASYECLKKDPSKELEVYMTEESGTTLTVTRIKGPGLTIDECR